MRYNGGSEAYIEAYINKKASKQGIRDMSKQGERAAAYFSKGYNCCQSVVAAFAEELGITEAFALRFSSGFGAGIGRMREVCGAFNGLTAVIGIAYADPTDPEDKSRIYAIIQELAAEFKAQNGQDALLCKELLGLEKAEGSAQASARTEAYYQSRPCPELVRLAADLTADYMEAHPVK